MFDDSHYRNKPGYIYLIHAQETDRYKIGLTTRSVEARFAELNSSQSPYPLEIIDWFETDNVTDDEEYLHEKFADYRVHGEWFGAIRWLETDAR
ncbi:MAG: GIY-YIG nuclease family protein [Symploca sp. SIO2D2]|nr:GIY-YIG nuclease family protein [Symploca sp. SIO2D2]